MAFNNGARGQFRLQADINGWTLIHHDDHNDTFEKNGVKIGVAYRTNYSFGKAWLAVTATLPTPGRASVTRPKVGSFTQPECFAPQPRKRLCELDNSVQNKDWRQQ
jgi:hypothetical protein